MQNHCYRPSHGVHPSRGAVLRRRTSNPETDRDTTTFLSCSRSWCFPSGVVESCCTFKPFFFLLWDGKWVTAVHFPQSGDCCRPFPLGGRSCSGVGLAALQPRATNDETFEVSKGHTQAATRKTVFPVRSTTRKCVKSVFSLPRIGCDTDIIKYQTATD